MWMDVQDSSAKAVAEGAEGLVAREGEDEDNEGGEVAAMTMLPRKADVGIFGGGGGGGGSSELELELEDVASALKLAAMTSLSWLTLERETSRMGDSLEKMRRWGWRLGWEEDAGGLEGYEPGMDAE